MLASIRKALGFLFNRASAGMVLRCLVLTLLLFFAALAFSEYLLSLLPVLGDPHVNRILKLLAPVLLVLLMSVLGAPVAALFGSLFLDHVAARIEARDYPNTVPLTGTLWASIRASAWLSVAVLLSDLALLPLDIGLPGLGHAVTLLVDGWLLGWEYFELVALRHLPRAEVTRLRHAHAG